MLHILQWSDRKKRFLSPVSEKCSCGKPELHLIPKGYSDDIYEN